MSVPGLSSHAENNSGKWLTPLFFRDMDAGIGVERNVSCVNTRVLIEYVKRYYHELMDTLLLDLDPFFDSVPDVETYLLDEHNWVSQHVCVKLFQRVRDFSGIPDIGRKIGLESVIHHHYGYLENIFVKSIGNPYLSLLRVPYINSKFNKTKSVELVELDSTHAIIRLKWFKDIGTTKDICYYNQGVYSGLPCIWQLPPAQLVEHQCFFEGAEYCEYQFVWQKKNFFENITSLIFHRGEVLKDSINELEKAKAQISRKYIEIENLNRELEQRIERLTSLNACSKATSSILDTDVLLDVVMSLILTVMKFDRALLFMVDHENGTLRAVKGAGGTESGLEPILSYGIPLDRTQNILARVVDSGIAQIVTDVDQSFLRKENLVLKAFNPKSFVAVPLITRNRVIGVLAVERLRGLADFSSNDLEYMLNFCNQIAGSLENAHLIDSMKQSFVSSILSLATALEAKDPYTRGHSNRVATYSAIIARRLGLDEERVESIRLMSLMHDIGKIGIPDRIIMKPESLTSEEFSQIKRHPLYGLRIIQPLIENKPELGCIRNHHERFDGTGYPDGLRGDAIPLEARIMTVSDCFDAMTSDRPYRSAMSRREALREIEKNRGTQFSGEIVDVFLEVINTMPDDLYHLISHQQFEPAVQPN